VHRKLISSAISGNPPSIDGNALATRGVGSLSDYWSSYDLPGATLLLSKQVRRRPVTFQNTGRVSVIKVSA
jgi:hypothetical protein